MVMEIVTANAAREMDGTGLLGHLDERENNRPPWLQNAVDVLIHLLVKRDENSRTAQAAPRTRSFRQTG